MLATFKKYNIAFLMEGRDYVDDKKDVGRKVRINIGNPDLDFAKAAYVMDIKIWLYPMTAMVLLFIQMKTSQAHWFVLQI